MLKLNHWAAVVAISPTGAVVGALLLMLLFLVAAATIVFAVNLSFEGLEYCHDSLFERFRLDILLLGLEGLNTDGTNRLGVPSDWWKRARFWNEFSSFGSLDGCGTDDVTL